MEQEKIVIKNSWDEIYYEGFEQIIGILSDENLMEVEKKVKIICLLSGKNEEFFNRYKIDDLNEIYNVLTFLNEQPNGQLKEYYQIGERTYKRVSDLTKLDFGQFVDLNEDLVDKDAIQNKIHIIAARLLLPCKPLSFRSKLINKLHSIISKSGSGKDILRRLSWKEIMPEAEPYLLTPIEETSSNIYKNARIVDIMGLSVFFYLLGSILGEVTLHYLESQKNEQLKLALMTMEKESETNPKMKPVLKKLQKVEALRKRTHG